MRWTVSEGEDNYCSGQLSRLCPVPGLLKEGLLAQLESSVITEAREGAVQVHRHKKSSYLCVERKALWQARTQSW